jgi:adenylate cyclase
MSSLDWIPMKARRLMAGLVVTGLAVGAEMSNIGLPLDDALDRMLYDTRLRMQPAKPNNRVLIVDIDERSLAEQGAWPWPRERIARLTDIVANEGSARAVGLDLVFAEPHPREDDHLIRVLQSAPVAIGYYFSSELGAVPIGQLPQPAFSASVLQNAGQFATNWNGYGANTAAIARAARASGFFNPVVDRDGVVRSLPLLAQYRGELYESLAVSVLRLSFGNQPVTLHTDGARNQTLGFGIGGQQARVPISIGTTALVPYQGKGGPGESRFRYVSATDVLKGRVEPRLFRERVVLIGTTAPGLAEPRMTPMSDRVPSLEIHASLVAGALEGTLRSEPSNAYALELVLITLVGVGAALAMASAGVGGVIGVTALGVSVLIAWNAVAYTHFRWVLPLACGLLTLFGIALVNLVASYLIEGRARRAVIGLFGQYVAPQLVERITDNPHHFPLDSQDKELTILFADIRGFTRMAEGMSPQQLRDFLNRFLTTMTEVIHAHDGTVDKYIGDAVMAFWGAPIDDPHHADRAVAAAIAMQEAVARLSDEFQSIGLPPISVGIGINTGVVRVGDMGSRLRRSYTVIGDAVNLAARLEGLSKRYSVPIVIGDATRLAVRSIALQFVVRTAVAGRSEEVGIWTPVALESHAYAHGLDAVSDDTHDAMVQGQRADHDASDMAPDTTPNITPELVRASAARTRLAHSNREPVA